MSTQSTEDQFARLYGQGNVPKRPIVWAPIPDSSQELALDTRCHHTLYCGTRGPGKTDTQLMRFRRRVGIGYGAYWRGIIFDREYKNLDDLITKSRKWFGSFNDGAVYLAGTSALKWVWPTGEELLFRAIKVEDDYNDYHGHEYPFIGWNELTKYPTSELYDMMMSCNRSSYMPEKDGPRDREGKLLMSDPIPLEVFSTCNPWGAGHGWVKSRFIDVAAYGQIVKTTVNVYNPRTKLREDVVRTQVAIFGSYKENIYLDTGYIAELEKITDENMREAWLNGNWDIIAGGAIDDVWKRSVHVIKRFQIPNGWELDRSFDWGSSAPCSTGWWAESTGEEIEFPDGSKWCPQPGSLIQIAEHYVTTKLGTNKGRKKSSSTVAEELRDIESQLLVDEWLLSLPLPGPADNQIRDVKESDEETIEDKMAKKGIRWQRSDKSKGSRIIGLELFRERLRNALTGEGPAIYFMENCVASIKLLPALERDPTRPDDVDTECEDHNYDMVRYRVLKSNNRATKKLPVKFVN